jgi:hypothetical protein
MSTEPEVTRVVRSWLAEGADRMPDRVLDSVLDRLPTTPQRRPAWPARRFSTMSTPVRLGVAATAIAVVAVAGYALLPRNASVGVPTPTASPSPTPSTITSSGLERELAPGTYRVGDPFVQPFAISVPSTWFPKALAPGDVEFAKPHPSDGSSWPAWIVIDRVDSVFADPCRAEGGPISPPVPSTVDGLVAALTSLVGVPAGAVTDVVIDGHPGKTFTLTNSLDPEAAGCSGGAMLSLWTFKGASGTGEAAAPGGSTDHIWVIDVDGTPIVIDGETFSNTPAAYVQEIEQIVQGLDFE